MKTGNSMESNQWLTRPLNNKQLSKRKMKIEFMKLLQNRNDELLTKFSERMASVQMHIDMLSNMASKFGTNKSIQQHLEISQQLSSTMTKSQTEAVSTMQGQRNSWISTQKQRSQCLNQSIIALDCQNNREKFKKLSKTMQTTTEHLIQQLLSEQTKLQQQNDREVLIQLYQSRIQEIHYVLMGKETDIVTQHTGIKEGKFKFMEFRQFDGFCVEISNISAMVAKIHMFRRQVLRLQDRGQVLKQLQNMSSKSSDRTSASKKSSQEQKQNLDTKIKSAEQNPVLKSFSERYTFNDPFFRRILRIFKQELQREEKLKKQYQKCCQKIEQINKQHQQLVKQLTKSKQCF